MANKKKDTPVRLGIIGAGLAVKRLHWPALERLTDQFQIVQTCDIDPAAAQEVAELVGATSTTTDYKEVLANSEVEAVLLSLPIHLAAQFILEAARAGKHVLCEKPLASNWEQAQALLKGLQGVPVIVEIAENHHYRPDIAKAREWIDAGRIGQVFLVQSLSFGWSSIDQGFASTPWRQDNQYRGGVLSDATVHEMASLRALGGDVEQLQAFVKSIHPVMGGYDTIVFNARFRSGALGQITYSGAAKPGGLVSSSLNVYGTDGTITINEGKVNLSRPAPGNENKTGEGNEVDSVEIEKANGYYEEFLNFYNAIRNGEPVKVTPAEALKDFQLVMKALDSAESREVVLL